jgi:hypothetical protein
MAEIDHIVVGARNLAEGAAFIEQQFGVTPAPGGAHAGIGTHNCLLGLGPDCYLEVIAPDPGQPQPAQARPFDLDEPAVHLMLEAGPRLLGWVARTPALAAVVARLGATHAGEIRPWRRGDLSWRMAMPPQAQDMRNLIPSLIQWDTPGGAASRLPDSGWRLAALAAEHPDPDHLRQALSARGLAEALPVRPSPHARLVAHLAHADGGERVLASG